MNNTKNATALDALVVLIISISFVSIASLALNVFNVHVSVLLGLNLTLLVFGLKKDSWQIKINLKSPHVFPIMVVLAIGLLFRSEPYHYVAGGQDQGVYVSMSQYYDNTGKIFIEDEVRKNLPDNLKADYDSENSVLRNKQGQREYAPGVYVQDLENSEYVFQFYQMHPVWMSIFGKIFGDTNRVYSLVFFSLLSLVAFYLLAFELTKRKDLALLAGALLAINPLHAFFSKFPVAEVVGLAFTTLSFYYLLKYYNLSKQKIYLPVNLTLSALLMSGMFFTRISGLMLMPFFFIILIMAQIYVDEEKIKKSLTYYVFFVFLIYALSIWYGLVFSNPYSEFIYSFTFKPILGEGWAASLWYGFGLSILLYTVVLLISKYPVKLKVRDYLSRFRIFIPYLFLGLMIIGLCKVYQLGFNGEHSGFPQLISTGWELQKKGWVALLHWSVFVLFEYLSPFIAVVFFSLIFSTVRKNDAARTLLVLFILLFFVHITFFFWFVRYHYYDARYLVGELLPFVLLFTIVSLDSVQRFKKITYFLVGMGAAYMLVFTTMQFKGKEMHGLHSSMMDITKHVGPDDILILDDMWWQPVPITELKTTLKFYYNIDVITAGINDTKFKYHFCDINKDVYSLTSASNIPFGELIESIEVKAEFFERTNVIPTRVIHSSASYYLFKVSCGKLLQQRFQKDYTLYKNSSAIGQLKNFNTNHLWTKATSRLTGLDIRVDANDYLVLETFGYNSVYNDMAELGLRILVNDKNALFLKQLGNKYYFTLPDLTRVSTVTISSNTFNPKMMGMSQDSRDLGVDIKTIKLMPETVQ